MKILKVFTKEFRQETKFLEFIENRILQDKLQSNDFNIDKEIQRLKKNNYKSNFKMIY